MFCVPMAAQVAFPSPQIARRIAIDGGPAHFLWLPRLPSQPLSYQKYRYHGGTEMHLSPPHTILISQTIHVAAASDTIPADDIIVQSQLLLLTQWLLQTPTKTQTWVGHFATWPATNLASLFVIWPDTKKGPFHNSQMKYKKA